MSSKEKEIVLFFASILMFGAVALNPRYFLLNLLKLAVQARIAGYLLWCGLGWRMRFVQELISVNATLFYLGLKLRYLFFKRFVHKLLQGRSLSWHLKLFRLTLELRYLRFQDRYSGSVSGFHEMFFQDGSRPSLKGFADLRSFCLQFTVKLLRYSYIELCHAKPITWLNYKVVNGKFVKQPDKHGIYNCNL